MSWRDSLLGGARCFEWSRRLIGAQREMQRLVAEVVRPHVGMRILDFGCGNGRLVEHLPDVAYVGIDSNPAYVAAAAARRGGARRRFVCGDLRDLASLAVGPVDAVVAVGVLHHLDDEAAAVSLAAARSLLGPGGRMITMDPCFEPTQRAAARVLMALDRGRYVRHPGDYERLVGAAFPASTRRIWHDVFRFPYTHCVLEARAG